MKNLFHVKFIRAAHSIIASAARKLFPQRTMIVLSILLGILIQPLLGKTMIMVSPSDSTVSTERERYNETIQHHYVNLCNIISISTDSVMNHINETDTWYSCKLAAVHDSLSLLLPSDTGSKFRDSLTVIYTSFAKAMARNSRDWTRSVHQLKEFVLLHLSRDTYKFNGENYSAPEDYAYGISLFDNYSDSLYQAVKDTIADYSDNAGSSINNLFATLRDSLQGLAAVFIQQAGEDFKSPAETGAGAQSEIPAQRLSLYASFSRRYDRNPLYNYQRIGDQMWQSYHELKYLAPLLSGLYTVKYTGSLNLFNTLSERNYYESFLTGKYRIAFRQDESPISDDAADDTFEKFRSLNITVSASQRFDKHYYNDYNNHGISLIVSFKNPLSDSLFVTVKNTFSSRKYEISSELSNYTELLSADLSGKITGNFTYGVLLQAGIKKYSETLIDTIITGYTNNVESQPVLSFFTQPVRTYHSSINFRLLKSWEASSAQFTIGYTTNFNSKARFIRKNINKPFLTEDIYYDFFSYIGEDARIELQKQIPLNIRMNVNMDFHSIKLYLPAYNLSGIKTAENRHDVLSGLTLIFSRYFDSGLGFGYDVNISGGIVRRMSKDEYNDFSSYYTSAGISVGL